MSLLPTVSATLPFIVLQVSQKSNRAPCFSLDHTSQVIVAERHAFYNTQQHATWEGRRYTKSCEDYAEPTGSNPVEALKNLFLGYLEIA